MHKIVNTFTRSALSGTETFFFTIYWSYGIIPFSKTVEKASVQTSTSDPDYAGTTTQVATSSRATSQTMRTTTTTTTSVANSKKYTNLTKEQKVFISTIAGEGMWTAKGKPVSTVARQSIANVIVNRVGSREWKDYTTVSEICANTGFDAYDDNN